MSGVVAHHSESVRSDRMHSLAETTNDNLTDSLNNYLVGNSYKQSDQVPRGKDCALARPNKDIAAAAVVGNMAAAAAALSARFAQPADNQYCQQLEIAVDSGNYQNLSYLYACFS